MTKIPLTLNGKPVEIEAGTTILNAARQNGIEIPTLCHDPRLEPTAACRICLVEVKGARGPVAACITPVREGMEITTLTDEIFKLRQMALELLISNHYGDCIAPCKLACPAGIDIQGYIGLIACGEYREAIKLIKESNPLPLVCGRVCPRFCEDKCRRNLVDEPVAINALKRFAADYDLSSEDPYVPEKKAPTGHRVAVIGGGPAGLTAAYYLALEGHEVTIFESSPESGGWMRYGIPEYRLPKNILDKEIASITRLCQQVNHNTSLGRDFTIESLKSEGYDAIFLGLGAQASQKLGLDGENMDGVLSGTGFLKDFTLGKEIYIGRRVIVSGGGNTAIDSARTALRLGAEEVTIMYRRSRDQMPASPEEVEQAEQEGIRLEFLATPVKINSRDGHVSNLECIRMALGEPDASGRRRPEPITGSEFTMGADTLIAAVGQTLDRSSLVKNEQSILSQRSYININADTQETPYEGVFAGGDCTSGPATVVQAIAAGRRAAVSINQYLNHQPVIPPMKQFNCSKGEPDDIDTAEYENTARIPRTKMPTMGTEVRRKSFREIESGFTREMAAAEAERCLACGCQDVQKCRLRQLATEYKVDENKYFSGIHRYIPANNDKNQLILMDPNKCILCGRCARICNEVQGHGVLGFSGRGFTTKIEPSLGLALYETTCDSCGQCVSTCPTGALTAGVRLPKPGPWKTQKVPTVCPYCGVGCNIELEVIGSKITGVTSPVGNAVNDGNLCKKGAFGPLSLHNTERLRTPMVKKDGVLVEADWEEAIAMAAQGLTQIKEQSGGEKIGVIVSPQLTNEESYLVQKMARTILNTSNLGCLTLQSTKENLIESMGNVFTCSYGDVLNSDLILVFGHDVTEDYPIIDLKVRKAVAGGSQLITFNSRQTRVDTLARINLKVNRRHNIGLLKAILAYILSHDLVNHDFVGSRANGFMSFAREIIKYPLGKGAENIWTKPSRIVEATELYVHAKRPVIIVNADTISPAELYLLSALTILTGKVDQDGAGILALRAHGNSQGLLDTGMSPNYLPGRYPINSPAFRQNLETYWGQPVAGQKGKDADGIIMGIETLDIKGIISIGVNALVQYADAVTRNPTFYVLIDTAPLCEPPYPDVVLPAANFAESDGTFTNSEERVQILRQAITPPGGRQNREIIAALSSALGYDMNYPSAASIRKEIEELIPHTETPGGLTRMKTFSRGSKFNLDEGLKWLRIIDIQNTTDDDITASVYDQ